MSKSKDSFTELETKLINLQHYLNYINYINDQTSKYFKSVVESSKFFSVSYINARKLLIIDLNKILNHKENNNLVTYINSLLQNYSNLTWAHPIDFSELRILKKELQEILKSDLFLNIKVFRDKFYVHDDPKKMEFKAKFKMDDIENLIKKLHHIYKQVNYRLKGENFSFEYNDYYNELQKLNTFNDLRDIIYESYINQKESIPTYDLYMILRK